jgi:hypothetical protein
MPLKHAISHPASRLSATLLVLGSMTAAASAHVNQAYEPRAEGNHAMTMQYDLAHRSPDIHWPEGFNPSTADIFSHNELVIHATCERIWNNIIDADKWPSWYPNAKDVQIIDGGKLLSEGTVFRWTTFGLPLESRIHEFVPYSRIGWYGYAPGAQPTFYHTWYLEEEGDACRVVTDEVGKGPDAIKLRQADEGLMHRGHDLWLATLKWMSEGK